MTPAVRVIDGGAFPQVPVRPELLEAWEATRSRVGELGFLEALTYRGLREGSCSWEDYAITRQLHIDCQDRERIAFAEVRDSGRANQIAAASNYPDGVRPDDD